MRLAAVLLVLMLSSGDCRAQTVPVTRILVCPDTSGSLDSREYEAACQAVIEVVALIVDEGAARELAILPWAYAKDCAVSPRWKASLPARPAAPTVPVERTESAQLFKRVRVREAQAATSCRNREEEQLLAGFRQTIARQLTEFRQHLLTCRQSGASCTAIGAILARCFSESPTTLCLVITDGIEECGTILPGPLPEGARTVIVLVPTRASMGTRTDQTARRLTLRAPWATVIPSFRLSDTTVDWPAVLLRSGPQESSEAFSKAGRSSR